MQYNIEEQWEQTKLKSKLTFFYVKPEDSGKINCALGSVDSSYVHLLVLDNGK